MQRNRLITLVKQLNGWVIYTGKLFLGCTHVMRRTCWCTKQWRNVAQVLHNNRTKFPKYFFHHCSLHQHGRRDIRCKPRIRQNLNQTNCNIKSAEITHCSVTCRAAKKYRAGTGYTISGQRYYSSDTSLFWPLRPVAIVNPDCTVILL